jgi:hypothetical protein
LGNLTFSTTNEKYIFLKYNYFRADLFSRTLPLREKNVLIFAHFGFVREIARHGAYGAHGALAHMARWRTWRAI